MREKVGKSNISFISLFYYTILYRLKKILLHVTSMLLLLQATLRARITYGKNHILLLKKYRQKWPCF